MTILPLLCLLAWALAFRRQGRAWIDSMIAALVTVGVIASIGTEAQSRLGMLTESGSAGLWAIAAALGLLCGRKSAGPLSDAGPSRTGAIDRATIGLFLGVTLLIALISAPNSYDGMTYHLSRVERWVEQGSIGPFATHDTRQLFMPSWSEYALLQLRLLSGGDRYANLVQWFGFAGMTGGVALLARALGGGRIAAGLAALLAVTLPMAVVQASGTQTDVIAACWAVAACGFGYRLVTGTSTPGDAVLSAAAVGLAAATKQTAFLCAGAALLPAIALLAWRGPRRVALVWTGLIVVSLVVIAGPQLVRNRGIFGSASGDPGWLVTVVSGTTAPNHVLGTMVRNVAIHFGAPSAPWNEALTAHVSQLSRIIGADPDDPRTTWAPPFTVPPWSTREEIASNPLHLLLFLGCLVGLTRSRDTTRILFAGALVAGFVVFCASLKWQFYHSRLHTPFFALAIGWTAIEIERWNPWARRLLAVLLALGALPQAMLNYTRPLLTLPSLGITPRASVLSVPRDVQYFSYHPALGRAYWDVSRRIVASGCADVGLSAWPDAWEYAVRALVRNGGGTVRFRSVEVRNPSARFTVEGPRPCLLLHLGLPPEARPPWAADWETVADHRVPLGGIALFRPRP
jgi:4-amino-4-deoxy-L-arabinose transferase-like glycosyltransferase